MAHGKIEKRGQRRRKIKPVILIVTEGSQTEPKYFEHYRKQRWTRGYKRYKETSGLIEWKECQIFHSIFT